MQSSSALSEDKYLEFRNELNNERRSSGHLPLPDSELVRIIKHLIGRIHIPRL